MGTQFNALPGAEGDVYELEVGGEKKQQKEIH